MKKRFQQLGIREIESAVNKGARFISYEYCISLVVISFRRQTRSYLVRAGTSRLRHGFKYSAISAVLGWWGFPFGILYTFGCLHTNFRGGIDVTEDIMSTLLPDTTTRILELQELPL